MDFFEVIKTRHSYRGVYTDAPIPEDDLVKIVDAGLRAPSGCNGQTTDFIIVTNAEMRKELALIVKSDAIRTAPAIIVAVTQKHTFDFGLDFEVEDYAAAVSHILLAAAALGYAACWYDGETRLGGCDAAVAGLLGTPQDRHVRTLIPVGIPEQPGKQAPRKPFDERVTWRR